MGEDIDSDVTDSGTQDNADSLSPNEGRAIAESEANSETDSEDCEYLPPQSGSKFFQARISQLQIVKEAAEGLRDFPKYPGSQILMVSKLKNAILSPENITGMSKEDPKKLMDKKKDDSPSESSISKEEGEQKRTPFAVTTLLKSSYSERMLDEAAWELLVSLDCILAIT